MPLRPSFQSDIGTIFGPKILLNRHPGQLQSPCTHVGANLEEHVNGTPAVPVT